MYTATGGGGGGFTVDRAGLVDVAGALQTAASDLDGLGTGVPGTGAAGEAAALLAAVLAGFTGAGARIAVETSTIATTVEQCADGYGTADAAQAESYLVGGSER
jgi:hypothetical protein